MLAKKIKVLALFIIIFATTIAISVTRIGLALPRQPEPTPIIAKDPSESLVYSTSPPDFSGYTAFSDRYAPPESLPLLSGLSRQDFCYRHNLSPYVPAGGSQERRIYDLVVVDEDFDDLEVRLGQLYPYVDFFVVAETDYSWDGHPNPAYLRANIERLKPFQSKIMRYFVPTAGIHRSMSPDRVRALVHNSLTQRAIPALTDSTHAPASGDIFIYGELDEIPRPDALMALRHCQVAPSVSLEAERYQYSFQFRAEGSWMHPQAFVYNATSEVIKLMEARASETVMTLPNSAWYYEYCVPSFQELTGRVMKMLGVRKPREEDMKEILARVRFGKQMYHDPKFSMCADNQDIPEFVRQNPEYFAHMLDRTPLNANFKDLPADGNYSAIHWPR